MPQMNTDVSLHDDSRTILIECKWTAECLERNWGAKSLRADHVYQLHAYVRNHPRGKDGKLVEGFLLYPEVTEPLDVEVFLEGQWMGAHTVDLTKNWMEVHGQLMSLIQYSRI
jgi:5-methylcytosine-specific restriction enzyme subunit McrC